MTFAEALGRTLSRKTQNTVRAVASLLALACAFGSLEADAAGAIPASERAALIDFYNSTNGANWTNKTGWLDREGTECSWFGVTCNAAGTTITQIYSFANGVTGTLPASITQLVNLQYFTVRNNKLTGSIPQLTGMNALVAVDLDSNLLGGTIGSFSKLPALQVFSAQGNLLTGSIPALIQLPKLRYLYLNNNRLGGSIPALNSLLALKEINLNNNALTGSVPTLAGLTNLLILQLSNNRLSGSLPSLDSLSALLEFKVGNNQLTGPPPALPTTNSLFANGSTLCPNPLSTVNDPAWDTATGSTPWSIDCTTTLIATPVPSAGGIIFPDWPQLTGSAFVGSVNSFARFSVVPNAGFGVVIGGTCARGTFLGTTYLVTDMYFDCTVVPTFSNAMITVTVGSTAGGTVTPPGAQSALFGSEVTVTGTPDAGYRLRQIATFCGGATDYRGVSVGSPQPNSVTIATRPINGDCSVTFEYEPLIVNVTASAAVVEDAGVAHGSVSPTSRYLPQGQSATFTVTPDVGYRTDNVQGCGATLVGNIATTAALTADCNMAVILAKTCALDVDSNLSTTTATDGALILRYLMGFRGAALVDGLAGVNPANAAAIATYVADHSYRGVEPSGPTAAVTGLILFRLMSGFPDTTLLAGIARPAGSPLPSAAAIRADVNAQCASHF